MNFKYLSVFLLVVIVILFGVIIFKPSKTIAPIEVQNQSEAKQNELTPNTERQNQSNNNIPEQPKTVSTNQSNSTQYHSDSVLKLGITYPSSWILDRQEMLGGVMLLFAHKDSNEMGQQLLSISKDTRKFKNFEEIKNYYQGLEKEPNSQNFTFENLKVAGQPALSVAGSAQMFQRDIYWFYQGELFVLGTNEYQKPEVKDAIASIKIIK